MATYFWQTSLVHFVSDRTFDILAKRTLDDCRTMLLTSEDGLLLYDLALAVGCRLDDISEQYVLTLAALAETGREMASKRLRQADSREGTRRDRAREVVMGMEAAKRRLQTRQQSLAYTVRAVAQGLMAGWQEATQDVVQ